MSLKQELIRLGSTNPELRPHIRKVLAATKEFYVKDSDTAKLAKVLHNIASAMDDASALMSQIAESQGGSPFVMISKDYQRDFNKSFDEMSPAFYNLANDIASKGFLLEK